MLMTRPQFYGSPYNLTSGLNTLQASEYNDNLLKTLKYIDCGAMTDVSLIINNKGNTKAIVTLIVSQNYTTYGVKKSFGSLSNDNSGEEGDGKKNTDTTLIYGMYELEGIQSNIIKNNTFNINLSGFKQVAVMNLKGTNINDSPINIDATITGQSQTIFPGLYNEDVIKNTDDSEIIDALDIIFNSDTLNDTFSNNEDILV